VRRVWNWLVIVPLTVAAGCAEPAEVPYTQQVEADRAAKNQAFMSSPDSPVPPGDRPKFVPLSYFPVDEGYRVPAQLVPSPDEPAVEMPTSTGKRRQMRRAGRLQFSVKGQPLTLTAFVEAGDREMARLFLPFGDQTNGTETYAAGRYLDLDRTGTGLYDLDFNRAYHPYCYYNPEYDCPYPPRENRLPTPIRSGERNGQAAPATAP
jgi:uncharacterized protein (DUF1684 family)